MNDIQKVFNHAVNKTLEQGEPCVDRDGNCLLRNERGLSCTIGHCINDDAMKKYGIDVASTGLSASELCAIDETLDVDLSFLALDKLNGLRDDHLVLHSLQVAHDDAQETENYEWVYDFLTRVQKVAEERSLSMDGIKYELVEPTGENE